MRPVSVVLSILLVAPVLQAATVQRTFVSATGLDTNTCARDQPCRNFAAAISQTSANGEVIVLDSAGYGHFTVDKAVTIAAPLGVHAALTIFSGDGITVNANPSDIVILRNIYVNSLGGASGVTISQVGAAHLEHLVVNGTGGHGIWLYGGQPAKLFVLDTIVRNASGNGLEVGFTSQSGPSVTIDGSRFEMNAGDGVVLIRGSAAISNTVATQNGGDGFDAGGHEPSTAPGADVILRSCTASFNGMNGGFVSSGSFTAQDTAVFRNIDSGFQLFVVEPAFPTKLSILSGAISNNAFGVRATNVFGTGVATLTVAGSSITSNGTGISTLIDTTLSANVVASNTTGVEWGGSNITTIGHNLIASNGADVMPAGAFNVIAGK
jgi:parallel beta helix pectate lyase-like protein